MCSVKKVNGSSGESCVAARARAAAPARSFRQLDSVSHEQSLGSEVLANRALRQSLSSCRLPEYKLGEWSRPWCCVADFARLVALGVGECRMFFVFCVA